MIRPCAKLKSSSRRPTSQATSNVVADVNRIDVAATGKREIVGMT
jgi:hypothetical protein